MRDFSPAARFLPGALLWLVLALAGADAGAVPPVVTNVRAAQRAGTKLVDIYYDVAADVPPLTAAVQVSADDGATFAVNAVSLTGAVGGGLQPGSNRHVVWNAGADWDGQFSAQVKFKIIVNDSNVPTGTAQIPAGNFQMGDNLDGRIDAMPVHNVTLDAFFIDRTEVTKELWQSVQAWSNSHGYNISTGTYYATGHPVQTITWYDAVKWCNARSEKDGLTPCYYTDTSQTVVYHTGNTDITNTMVNWAANGYRLPTEAEWEKAARGGATGLRFPWGNTVNGSQANYSGNGAPFPSTTPIGYYNGAQTPVGIDMANGYGLYDMAGNVWEWCWDWYGSTYYADVTANASPHGPTTGTYRCLRGGAYQGLVYDLHCAIRRHDFPISADALSGFRCVHR